MQNYDPQKAAEVWKRVQSPFEPALDPADLLAMIAQEKADAVTYLHLSRYFQGRPAMLLRRISQQDQSHAACLSGIYMLITGHQPKLRTGSVPRQSPRTLLRQCYGRKMRTLTQYRERENDPEYGQVFTRLADREQEHCQTLLLILGNLKSKNPG